MKNITTFFIASALSLCGLAPALAMPDLPEPEPVVLPPLQWRMPLDTIRVSSFFGAARGHHAHAGIDFSIPRDTPVMATDGGVVVASTNRYDGDRKYGEVVVIEHLNGLRSLYAHLNQRSVNVGDEVAAGQPIGLSGATGHSTGPHLHLEAFRDGARVDPQILLASLKDNALPSALRDKSYNASEAKSTGKSGSRGPARSRAASKREKPAPAHKSAKSRKRS
jgi:murein DD-endopeptidase MepM/ murein hydrolase activator NlpD